MVKPRTLAGFLELLPNEQIIFDDMKRKIEGVFLQNAFLPLETPVLEYSDVLLAKSSGETDKQVYRFMRGDTDLCMRFDQTVPLAKFVSANYCNLAFPFRRYAIGKVFRGERAQKGRFREFYQCDVDVIGDGELPLCADGEVLSVFTKLYQELGFDNFVVRINSRKLLSAFFRQIKIEELAGEVLRLIDKFYKMPFDDFSSSLIEIIGQEKAKLVIDFITQTGDDAFLLCERLKSEGYGEEFNSALLEFEEVLMCAKSFGADLTKFCFDLKTVRGLDYYTGIVFECFLPDHPEFGSVGGGGRYDNLTSCYSDHVMPGVGFGFGLTRLFAVLSENKMLSSLGKTSAQLGIVFFDETKFEAMQICAKVRKAGAKAVALYGPKNIKGKFNLANKLGVSYALVVGENELATGKYTLKDMCTGESVSLSLDEIIDLLLNKKEKHE